MDFITDADLHTLITPVALAELEESATTTKDTAEDYAISQAKDYLCLKYDTNAAFAASGVNRHQTLVMIICDMLLYHLHASIASRNMPEMRQKRYDDAIKWLEKVNKGTIAPYNMPVSTADDETDGVQQWGLDSMEKFNSDY